MSYAWLCFYYKSAISPAPSGCSDGSLLNDDLLDLLPLSFVTFHLQSVIACFENDPGVERARLLRVGPWLLPPRLEATIYATYGDRQRDSNISQSSDQKRAR